MSRLTPRKILRINDVFVSHTHMDHFVGFDQVLRIFLERRSRLRLFGPPGFIDRVEHKLVAYAWNLIHNYENDFTLDVTEVDIDGQAHSASVRCRTAFERARAPMGRQLGAAADRISAYRSHTRRALPIYAAI
ncbi:MAG: MBL fold metallo-hydrolase [Acidiferrobacterales bacterium]